MKILPGKEYIVSFGIINNHVVSKSRIKNIQTNRRIEFSAPHLRPHPQYGTILITPSTTAVWVTWEIPWISLGHHQAQV